MRLGELLLKDKHITHSQLKAVLIIQEEIGGMIGQILLENNCINEEILISYLLKQSQIQ